MSLLAAGIMMTGTLNVSGCGRELPGALKREETVTSTEAVEESESGELPGAAGASESGELPGVAGASESGGQSGTAGASESGELPGDAETAGSSGKAPVSSHTRWKSKEPLPERYDAREHGRTAQVQDQGDLGTCWAFASLLALESSLLPEQAYDFSEDHMSNDPNFALSQEVGGDYTMSMAYLLSWRGPVLETQDPYGDGVSPQGLLPARHVQEIQILPERDQETIKRAVLAYGGVQSSLYTNLKNATTQSEYYNSKTGAYCCPGDRIPNHDVVIVGWDDHFPKENFLTEVEGDGAFLCQNSWGPQFGEEGFFYVSYYDGNLGKTNLCYTSVEVADNYDRIYQSDLCGWIGQLGYGAETAWAANVYETGSQAEQLRAVGFYATGRDTDYEIYVVTDLSEHPAQSGSHELEAYKMAAGGHLDYSGYYTIRLPQAQALSPDSRFGIMVRLTTRDAVHPIAIEYDTGDGKCRIDLSDGEGYISPDGKNWESAENVQKCNLCLKAYTDLDETP